MNLFEELKRRNVFRVGVAYGVAAWVLLQVADLVLDNITAPEWVIQALMLVVGLGFLAALIIAWAYEITPEGIKPEAEIDRSHSVTHHTAKKLDVITLIAVAALLVFFVVDRFVMKKPSPEPVAQTASAANNPAPAADQADPAAPRAPAAALNAKSIAVLPLANRSTNPEDAFFAEGMHDEILTRLSRISALKVISRTSVMGYANTTMKMREIGEELGVATLLEGGVQRAGNRVRINVQLIEAATDKHLWAEIFDRELTADNLFDIQSEITRSISDALQAVLTGKEKLALNDKPTENVEAYAHYLRGKASSGSYGRSDAERAAAIGAYQSAITLDPRFAQAYAAMSTDLMETYWQSARLGDEKIQAHAALQKARELAPDSAETLIAEGYYHYWGFLDYALATEAFDKALALQPGSQLALRGKAYVLRRMGDLDQSIETMKLAISLDPMDFQMPADLGYSLHQAGYPKEAESMFRRALAADPDNPWNRWAYAYYFLTINDAEKARDILAPIQGVEQPYQLQLKFDIVWQLGDLPAMETIYESLKDKEGFADLALLAWARVHVARGDAAFLKPGLELARQNLLAADRKKPDEESTLSGLVEVFAFLGDIEKMNATIERMNAVLKPDAMRRVENFSLHNAYAISGDAGRFLDLMEQTNQQFGPWQMYPLLSNPLYQRFAGEPRYKQLALEYDRWLEAAL